MIRKFGRMLMSVLVAGLMFWPLSLGWSKSDGGGYGSSSKSSSSSSRSSGSSSSSSRSSGGGYGSSSKSSSSKSGSSYSSNKSSGGGYGSTSSSKSYSPNSSSSGSSKSSSSGYGSTSSKSYSPNSSLSGSYGSSSSKSYDSSSSSSRSSKPKTYGWGSPSPSPSPSPSNPYKPYKPSQPQPKVIVVHDRQDRSPDVSPAFWFLAGSAAASHSNDSWDEIYSTVGKSRVVYTNWIVADAALRDALLAYVFTQCPRRPTYIPDTETIIMSSTDNVIVGNVTLTTNNAIRVVSTNGVLLKCPVLLHQGKWCYINVEGKFVQIDKSKFILTNTHLVKYGYDPDPTTNAEIFLSLLVTIILVVFAVVIWAIIFIAKSIQSV